MKKLLSALLTLIAVFLAYAFASVSVSQVEGEELGFSAKLKAPFKSLDGQGIFLLFLGAVALVLAFYLVFSKSRSEKAKKMSSSQLATRFSMLGRKSKGLEVGFLFNGLLALGILALIIFGTVKAWFDEAVLGALGMVFLVQVLMGLLFLLLFIKKKEKAIVPFVPALALFLFQVAIGVFGFVMGPK